MTKKSLKLLIILLVIELVPSGALFADVQRDLSALASVMDLIKKVYVKDIGDKELVESAISGMLSGLDPHSNFMNEKEFEEMKTATMGEFGGVGVEIMVESPGLRVITPIDDSPAFKAGIKPADLIFAIDDQLISNMAPDEAIIKMRGPKNTKVKVCVIREGENKPLEFILVRDIIKANPVKSHSYEDYGYIRISSFSAQTVEGVKNAIQSMQKEAKKPIKGFVLDLRNNPGGILEQAVGVANIFLDKGIIVSTKGRDPKSDMVFAAKAKALVKNEPLVVLVNNGTASAPEIVAGALQDNKRALIVGTKSFGKGSVQTVLALRGYGAIKLTTALYYTPSGKSIQAEGIIPNIVVEPGKIEFLTNKDKKFQLSESSLKNHLANNSAISVKTQADMEKDKAEFWKSLYQQDYQLARAFDVLKSIVVAKGW